MRRILKRNPNIMHRIASRLKAETLLEAPPTHEVITRFPPPAPLPVVKVPKITFESDELVGTLLKQYPDLYRRSENDPTDSASDVEHHASLILKSHPTILKQSKGPQITKDYLTDLLAAERVANEAEIDTAVLKSLAAAPTNPLFHEIVGELAKGGPALNTTAGFDAYLNHAIITEFLGLPVRFYHDFAHGRGLHAKVDWAVFKFKYKWLKAALTKVVAAEAGVEQVVSVDVVKRKYEKLCDDPTREKVREFVATNILGGREYIKARILDEGMYEGSVDELLDSYGERYFADGSIITDYQLFPTVNGGLPYRRIPIHQATGFKQPVNEKGGAFKGYRGGDKHFPTMQDYTEGAYESTDPGYFRLTGEAPPDSLREYLDHLHWRMKRVRWDNITEEDIRFEFIRNEEIVDYEAKWFADNTKMLVSYVESEEVEEATLASIAETLEAAEAADEATPVTATAEEKENFKRWITFHNRCEEAEEERRKEIVATESVAQGARSAQAALVDAERLRYMQGDLLPDGSPNVDFLERAAQAKKSRGTTKRQDTKFDGDDDYVETEDDKVFEWQLSQVLEGKTTENPDELEAANLDRLAKRGDWDGSAFDEATLLGEDIGEFNADGEFVNTAMEAMQSAAREDYRKARDEARKKKVEVEGKFPQHNELKELLKVHTYEQLGAEKRAEIDEYCMQRSKMDVSNTSADERASALRSLRYDYFLKE